MLLQRLVAVMASLDTTRHTVINAIEPTNTNSTIITSNHARFEVGLEGTEPPSSVLNTFAIPAAPAFILAILFLFVAIVCFFKEVLPQLLLRWARYRQKPGSNYHKIVSLRILWFFSNVLFSATVRAIFFVTIAISGPTLLNKAIPLWLYYLLWFVPELATISAYTTLVYFWAKMYSNWRNLALFSQTAFRKKLHMLEAIFLVIVVVGQLVFYIVIISTPQDLSYEFQLANQYVLGIVSFFLAIAPISLFITLRYSCKPKIVPSVIPPSGIVNKLIFLVSFWALGRFTRAIDALSSFSDWQANIDAKTWLWVYVAPLYLIMELLPEILVLVVTLRRDVSTQVLPEQTPLRSGQSQPNERLRLISKVRKRIVREIDIDDIQFANNEILGKGNFATVYRGFYNDQVVAIKAFDKKLNMDRAFFELFCNEIQLMSELRHPNIVRFLGACISKDEQVFLVTELVTRGTLRSVLQDKSITITSEIVDKWSKGIANGMCYLHSLGIIHRDLKSDNLLIAADFTAKVADFGVSRFKDIWGVDESQKTMTQQVGSLCWMAPEMLDPSVKHYDGKVDVYSYGIILWEIITRDVPYSDERSELIAKTVMEGKRPPLPDDCEKYLSELMILCWSQDPNQRPSFQDILTYLYSYTSQPIRVLSGGIQHDVEIRGVSDASV